MVPSVCRLQSQINDLRYGVVIVRSPSGVSRSYVADSDSGAARYAKLVEALASTNAGDTVILVNGSFVIPSGSSLVDASPAENVKISFAPNGRSPLVYTNPEDASQDARLFRGARNILDFGAVSTDEGDTPVDCTKAFQAAYNSLELYPDVTTYELESGRLLRSGMVTAPNGTYWINSPVFYSPTTQFRGESMRGTVVKIMDSSATGAGSEVIFFRADLPVSVDVNNLFGTYWENVTISCPNPSLNTRATGLSVAGGQGTGAKSIIVTNFALRNVYAYGGSFTDCWFPECVRGPALDWYRGGYANNLSVEHVNPAGTLDPDTGERYPAVRMKEGHYSVSFLQGEEGGSTGQTLVEIIDVMSATIGAAVFNTANASGRTHIISRITGTSENVRIQELSGCHTGLFPNDVGKLVVDDSDFSPAGAGVTYELTAIRGTYSQKSGGFVPGCDLNNSWTGQNTFTGAPNASAGVAAQLGALAGTARLVLTNGDPTNRWEFDNGGTSSGPQLRWFWGGSASNLAMTLTKAGELDISGSYLVDGVKVLGNQSAAIADVTGGAVVDAECRAAFNDLLAKLRVHGTIAT